MDLKSTLVELLRELAPQPGLTGAHLLLTDTPETSSPTVEQQMRGADAVAELSRAEQRVLASIDESELVRELIDLIRVPSVTGTDAESDLQHRFEGQLHDLDFEVDAWKLDLPALEAHPDYPGREAARSEGSSRGSLST